MTIEQEKLITFLKRPFVNGSVITYPAEGGRFYLECLKAEKAGLLISKPHPDGSSIVFHLTGYDH